MTTASIAVARSISASWFHRPGQTWHESPWTPRRPPVSRCRGMEGGRRKRRARTYRGEPLSTRLRDVASPVVGVVGLLDWLSCAWPDRYRPLIDPYARTDTYALQ